MQQAYIVTGLLTDGNKLVLDESLPVPAGKVRVLIEVLLDSPGQSPKGYAEFMADLRERQRARGHVPRTREEIDAELRAERAGWDD